MVFVKGFNREKSVGYYNTDVFESIRIRDADNILSVCGYINVSDDYFDIITLRENFPTEKEAENWLAEKAKEWGITLVDPNH